MCESSHSTEEAYSGASAGLVGLIDLSRAAALNLNVDCVCITYSDGRSLGDPGSPVQLSTKVPISPRTPSQS